MGMTTDQSIQLSECTPNLLRQLALGFLSQITATESHTNLGKVIDEMTRRLMDESNGVRT